MFGQLGKKTSQLTVWGVPTAVYTCTGIFNNITPSCLRVENAYIHGTSLQQRAKGLTKLVRI